MKALDSKESDEEAAFRREVAILQTLRHPHVVSYLDYIVDDDGSVSPLLFHLADPHSPFCTEFKFKCL